MPVSDPILDRIIETHGGFVRALALRFAPTPGLVEDIAQQVFLEFIRKSEQWDLASDLRPLFAGMTRVVAARAWREKSRQLSGVAQDLADHIRDLAEAQEVTWFDEEEKAALRVCLEKLPDRSRRLVDLYYDVGVMSVDIARQMHMNADAVRRALFRLREQLRKCVQRILRERPG